MAPDTHAEHVVKWLGLVRYVSRGFKTSCCCVARPSARKVFRIRPSIWVGGEDVARFDI
jgi:hypothetical protein